MSDELEQATEAALVASRALLGVVAVSMAPILDRVTVAQFRVLVLLHTLGQIRSRDLADRLGVHPSTFSRTADRLVSAGFVRRLDNPLSRREVLVTLTPKGRRLVTSVLQRRADVLREILAKLSPKQRRAVVDSLSLFSAAADEPGYADHAGLLGA